MVKADENYQFNVSDAEVDRQAREQMHGHVTPFADGVRAKCGGPNGRCGVCRREQEILDWQSATPQKKRVRRMEAVRRTVEYQSIAAQYDDTAVSRPGGSYMDHLDREIAILLAIGAQGDAIRAHCLRPLVMSDEDLATFDPTLASNPTVLMYVMEYRNVANRYQSHHFQQETRDATPSPLMPVNQMLLAHLVTARTDFDEAESTRQDRRLFGYLTRWLSVLGVDEATYEELADLCAEVAAEAASTSFGAERH